MLVSGLGLDPKTVQRIRKRPEAVIKVQVEQTNHL